MDRLCAITFMLSNGFPHPVEQIFTFFGNPENLPDLMPPWQKAHIVKTRIYPPPPCTTSSIARLAGAGTRLTLSFRPIRFSPIRATWVAEIDQFAWNDHFCDTQLHGPFAFWHHCHRVIHAPCNRPDGTSVEGTWLLDELEYELPFGILGELAHRIAIREQIQSIFRYRHKRTKELLAASAREQPSSGSQAPPGKAAPSRVLPRR